MAERKVAVVTGGNKGIGYAIVKGLLEKFNGDVYLTARDAKRGQEAVEQLKGLGLNPFFHQLDITDQNSINVFRDYINTKHGGLDILVNNAAIYFQADAPEPVVIQISEIIGVNYFANLKVCEALFPLLRQNARVVNLSSTSGHLSKIPSPDLRAKFNDENLTIEGLNKLMEQYVKDAEEGIVDLKAVWGQPYRVSKVGFTKLSMMQQKLFDGEKPNRNITVNAVHPGYIATDLSQFKGPMSIEDGAKAPLFLALESKDIRGQYVWRDGSVVQWDAPDLPAPY